MSDDERAIRALIDTWLDATRTGDHETVLSLMTEDVVFLVPGRQPFGKSEFAASLRQLHGVLLEGRSEVQELHVLGDWA